MLAAASGVEPIALLRQAVASGDLDDARDPAAVLSWRLQPVGEVGPLPWLQAVPAALREDPTWGEYLVAREQRVRTLAAELTRGCGERPPEWLESMSPRPSDRLAAQLAVWRCAMGVPDTDRRPTGPTQFMTGAGQWQRELDIALLDEHPAVRRWTDWVRQNVPAVRRDPHTPVLGRELATWAGEGHDTELLVEFALGDGPLPDDHPAAALASRIVREIALSSVEETVSERPAHRLADDPGMRHSPPRLGPTI